MISRLIQVYESVGFRDLVQILILALVMYAVLRFLGRTCGAGSSIGRGFSVVVVGLFLLVQVVIVSLDLTELNWALDYLLLAALVALLVIFQPELRRGLIVLGRAKWWHYFAPPVHSLADPLAEAAISLSRDCVGALIAIQREVSLASYAETGQHIDAHLSPPLVRALFMPRNPLHDGAIILSRGRILAAACQLPLRPDHRHASVRVDFPMGMRHRAALSLSEETDAVVLVVSEETGRVSLAVGGRFEAVPRENLARRLATLLSAPLPQRKAA